MDSAQPTKDPLHIKIIIVVLILTLPATSLPVTDITPFSDFIPFPSQQQKIDF